jgi:hypothetical protein
MIVVTRMKLPAMFMPKLKFSARAGSEALTGWNHSYEAGKRPGDVLQ